jgi:hypothetical protein
LVVNFGESGVVGFAAPLPAGVNSPFPENSSEISPRGEFSSEFLGEFLDG